MTKNEDWKRTALVTSSSDQGVFWTACQRRKLRAAWPVTRSFSGAVGCAHCFREQGGKYWSSNSKPAAKADGQEPPRSWKAAKFMSRCLPAWDHSNRLRLPPNSRQKPEHFSQRPSSRDISSPQHALLMTAGNAAACEVTLLHHQRQTTTLATTAQRFQASTLWFLIQPALLPLKISLSFFSLRGRSRRSF